MTEPSTPMFGKLWWSADNMTEAEQWKADLIQKGATSVELKPEDDREIVDVIITLPLDKANEIVGYNIDPEEWLVD
ncbi:hypothetical protein [Aeromonas sp. MrichA-1]|uniref:hypothetical protein n=1 Tax=Aeromonas sp. MrichA-1 TaxID=2823362 RepID=UPI001B333EF8|nr:hypothetical protein [Aeromonas sp. MrichA-1]MBP4081293.1 hypothetical protein [Aeromonas sp. MrichA-1]